MTFKKNAIVVAVIVAFLMIVAYLAHTPREIMVYAGCFLIGAGVLFLAGEDVMRKYFTEREKITWQYGIGLVFIVVSVAVYVWALESVENIEFFLRLGLAVFLSGVGSWWFYNKYQGSLQNSDERTQSKFGRVRAKVFKAKTKEAATKTLNSHLRYRLVGDSLDGDLNLHAPLARYNDTDLNYDQLMLVEDDGKRAEVAEYIKNLVGTLGFEDAVEGGEA